MAASKRRGEIELTLSGEAVRFTANIGALERIQDAGLSLYELPARLVQKSAKIEEARVVIDATTEMGFDAFHDRFGLILAMDCAALAVAAGLGIDEEDGVKEAGKKPFPAWISGPLSALARLWAGVRAKSEPKA